MPAGAPDVIAPLTLRPAPDSAAGTAAVEEGTADIASASASPRRMNSSASVGLRPCDENRAVSKEARRVARSSAWRSSAAAVSSVT